MHPFARLALRRIRPLLATTALAASLCTAPATAQPSTDTEWDALQDGTVVLFRHANAPGGGDPPGLKIGDCSTQRNLDETGRAQARRIGERFRERRVPVGAVLTSQWCRTRETAELAFPKQARDDPNFNSFFGDAARGATQTAQAKTALSRWRGPGVLVVTTHQVNITALTGVYPGSGEGVVLRPKGDGVEVIGRLPP
jgi:phosphohistidine phosphatase SixA